MQKKSRNRASYASSDKDTHGFEKDRIEEAVKGIRKPSPYFEILKNRNFLFLWLGQAISNTGDWLIVPVLVILVKRLSGSATAVGALMIFKILPALLLSSVAGVLVDRLNRKRIMIVCDVARGALIGVLPFLNSLYQIYIVVFLMESFSLLFMPAQNASIPNLVDKDHVLTANSLSFTTNQLTTILGLGFGATIVLVVEKVFRLLRLEKALARLPLLGHFAPRFWGPHAVFTVDALSFFVSAASIAFIYLPPSEHVLSKIHFDQVKNDLAEGVNFLRGNPQIRRMIVALGIAIFGGGAIYTLGAFYSDQVLKAGTAGFGPLLTFLAVGALFGALLTGFLIRYVSKEKVFSFSILFFGIVLFLFASSSYFELALFLSFLGGTSLGCLTVVSYTILQERVKDEVRGRIFAALEAIIRISLLVSLILTGVFADIVGKLIGTPMVGLGKLSIRFSGSRVTLLLGGVIIILAGVFAYRTQLKKEVK